MKWLPVGVLALGVAIATYASEPLFAVWSTGAGQDGITGGVEVIIPLNWFMVLIYAPFLLAVVGGTVVAFRAMWLSTQRAELAAQLALGLSRGSLISRHVGEGIRHGLLAGLGGLFVGGALRQIVTGFDGVQFSSNSLWNYVAIVAVTVVSFVLAYRIAASWVTRGSVRAIASGQTADAPVASPPRGTRRSGGRVVLGATSAFAVLAVVLLIWSPSVLAADETEGAGRLLLAWLAAIVINIGVAIALPAVLIYAGARVAVRAVQFLGRVTARGAHPGSARTLAAYGVTRPTPMRTGAVAVMIAVMGVAVTVTALYFGNAESNLATKDVAPEAAVSTMDLTSDSAIPAPNKSGWAEPLPADVLAALHADPALRVLEAGVLVTDAREITLREGEGGPSLARDLLIAVDPAALAELSATAADRLYLADGIAWPNGEWGWYGAFNDASRYVEVDGVRRSTATPTVPSPWIGISRSWADETWGTSPTAAVLLYPTGDVSVQDALAAHDLGELEVEFRDQNTVFGGSASATIVATVSVPFLLLAVIVIVALAWSSQRLRARDHATMAALGATTRVLRAAAALESLLLTSVAALIGVAGGAVLGPVLLEMASAPLGTAGAGLLLRNIGLTLSVMPWGVIIGLVVGAAAIAAAGAALIRVRLDRMSPAQQLTEAQKAGTS